ncbi:hypothetical protein C2857_000543 [Epichloe festucae Fl1]|uniref:Phytoene desaturase n=1 Tax=Epichloe festucae (strain Fl1) TaxID=877507 RepID=A0A7S9PTP2_EPIFF|nr:hypothetical protein C2857_000543 [Epichloe festucae Fl1]
MADNKSLGEKPTAIVIGAGIGGVSTAARLAKAGFAVTVFEKNEFTGGRCSLLHHDGYRFDQGPSLLLLPRLFIEAFRDLDTSLEAEDVHLFKCEPNYTVHFHDGSNFELSTDLARMKGQVEKYEGADGFERYFAFLAESHRHYELSVRHVLHRNFTSLLSMLRPSFLRHVLTLHPFESMYARAARYFRTERLRRVFTFASMYMGMSPFEAPGTYSLLQYTELAEGVWYPKGGFHKVIEALVNVGVRLGVTYRMNTPVAQVMLDEDLKRARGVVLESGERVAADVVIVNADLVYATKNLFPPSRRAERLNERKVSCSSISFYWALDRQVPELHAHNIFLADEYRESFDAIFARQDMPDEPSFYLNVPSRVDPTAAPAGTDALVVLVPVGHLQHQSNDAMTSQDQDWTGMVSRAREHVLATVEARTGTSLRKCIRHEMVNTPATWRDRFNLDKGAILGLSHSFFNVLSFRPRTKHADYEGCYFVGSSTHPGAGGTWDAQAVGEAAKGE